MIGFKGTQGELDDLTVKADRDSNGRYETTEHVDDFAVSGAYGQDELTHYLNLEARKVLTKRGIMVVCVFGSILLKGA